MTNTARTKAHGGEMEKLLPWYATGKLDTATRDRVESALQESPELRKQLSLVRDEMKQSVAANEAMAMPPSNATKKFMAMIQENARPRVAKPNPFAEFMDWLSGQFAGPPRWAVAAALLAIVVQAAILGVLVAERQGAGYHTATGGGDTLAEGTLVLARFSDGATLADLGKQLSALDISIVSGPEAGGLYMLRIGPDDTPASERDRKIAALRASAGLVMFVGPVQ